MDETRKAFESLMAQMDPTLGRRDYPENPFTAVGTTVRYLAGVRPLASEGVLETQSRLPDSVAWVRLENVPTMGLTVHVHHIGREETTLENVSSKPVRWRGVFDGRHETLIVNDEPSEASHRVSVSDVESYVIVTVPPNTTARMVASARRP